jgi:hypothetical protein
MIEVRVTGDEAVAKLFDDAGGRVRAHVKRTVGDEASRLAKHISSTMLSGSPVGVRSGKLKERMVVAWQSEKPQSVTALVWPGARRGRVGYGFVLGSGIRSHSVRVESFNRRNKRADVLSVRRFRKGRMLKRKILAMGVTRVKEHTRKVGKAPIPFMRWGLDSLKDSIAANIEQAVTDAVNEIKGEQTGFSDAGGI